MSTSTTSISEISLNDLKQQLTQNSKNTQLELKLGDTKKVTVSKWSGKQILNYGKQIDNIEKKYLSIESGPLDLLKEIPIAIENNLINPSVQNMDNFYFNDMEKLYLLFNLRKLSIPNKPLSVTNNCSKCGNVDHVEINISDVKENIQLSKNGTLELSNGIILEISDMKNPKAMYSKNPETKLLNEICLRIQRVTYEQNTVSIMVFDDLMDVLTSLDNVVFNELLETYIRDFAFGYTIEKTEHTCTNEKCKHVDLIDCEDIVILTQGI